MNDNRAGLDRYTAHEVALEARRARARWIEHLANRAWTWLSGSRLGRFIASRGQRAQVEQLFALDDRTLADIGIRRADLFALASGETTLERLNAQRLGGSRGALVELRARARRTADAPAELDQEAPAELDRAA